MSEPIGIIYPPPDLRGIVDSTAKYVAKNGGAFEERIMREHKGKPKFSFLYAEDPFNAYYKNKVKEIRQSLLSDAEILAQQQQQSAKAPGDSDLDQPRPVKVSSEKETDDDRDESSEDAQNIQQQQEEVAQEGNDLQTKTTGTKPKLDQYIQEMTMKLEEPPHLNYTASPASFITHLESDIIKLTAQFVATYGRSFLLELAGREQGNSQFDFLKPQHGQFSYMTNLIMQYALIINAPLDILEQLEKDSTSQRHVLEKFRMRSEWNKMLELERRKKEEEQEQEKALYSRIDWYDFVIVETIDYQPGEKGDYPPTTKDHVGTRLLQQQHREDIKEPEEMDIDMDMDSDDETTQEVALITPNSTEIFIKPNYNPKESSKPAPLPDSYFVSPITNERVPVDKIHDHLKYNLADPRYLEKKEQMLQAKINDTAVFASGSQIQSSLKNLAERRTDIFGVNEEEAAIGRRIGDEEQELQDANKKIWDGHKSSLKRPKTQPS